MNMMIDTFDISVRLAGMLLLHDGEISVSDIEAIPFVQNRAEAHAVARKLAYTFEGMYGIDISSTTLRPEARLRIHRGPLVDERLGSSHATVPYG